MSQDIVKSAALRMAKAVEHVRSEMSHIRTGRATPILLDSVKVEYYGTPTPLKQVANITAPEPRLLLILPYDKGMIATIEKAILASGLGLTPQNDGKVIRLPIPMLTAERREELIRLVRRLAEEGRVAVRNIRRDANEAVKREEKEGEVSEDEAHRMLERTQKDTDSYIEEIDKALKAREEEIRME